MDLSLLKIAEKTAPRYTSYPTAPMFSAEVTSETYGKWLGELNADATLSLYLHIPYCKSICLYCGCHTFATRKEAPVLNQRNPIGCRKNQGAQSEINCLGRRHTKYIIARNFFEDYRCYKIAF
ncbi:MAG: oxygen-independent coproporphyrinogen III oxidase [Hyphomonadaceae bacterium]|nr:MAG: oxygen-independent coproporphyrinogen III oxidase [Hyphomonadaceae bacterium]